MTANEYMKSIQDNFDGIEKNLDKLSKKEIDTMLNALAEGEDFDEEQPVTGKWIPVSERLPEKAVLCCDVRGEMLIAYPFKDDDSYTGYSAQMDDYYLIDCIAWMPLPEPYKEVKE